MFRFALFVETLGERKKDKLGLRGSYRRPCLVQLFTALESCFLGRGSALKLVLKDPFMGASGVRADVDGYGRIGAMQSESNSIVTAPVAIDSLSLKAATLSLSDKRRGGSEIFKHRRTIVLYL